MKLLDFHRTDYQVEFLPSPPQPQSSALLRGVDRKSAFLALENYLTSLGADSLCLANCRALQGELQSVVLTGQQCGYYGGPLFTLLKAAQAVQISRKSEHRIVPVFWVVSEDHDLAEANSLGLISRTGKHLRFSVSIEEEIQRQQISIGNCRWNRAQHEALIKNIGEELGQSAAEHLDTSFPEAENYRDHFVAWLLRISTGTGLVPFVTDLPEIKQASLPLFLSVVENDRSLLREVMEAGRQIEASGGTPQLHKQPSDTSFFLREEGIRAKVEALPDGGYRVGEQRYHKAEILQMVSAHPERFSLSVISNPPYQAWVFRIECLVLGSGELAYHRQLPGVYHALDLVHPHRIERSHLTLLGGEEAEFLRQHHLLQHWRTANAESLSKLFLHSLPLAQQPAWDAAETEIFGAFRGLREKLGEELVGSIEQQFGAAEHNAVKQVAWLREKALKQLKAQQFDTVNKLLNLGQLLAPSQRLQERELSSLFWIAKYGQDRVRSIFDLPELAESGAWCLASIE